MNSHNTNNIIHKIYVDYLPKELIEILHSYLDYHEQYSRIEVTLPENFINTNKITGLIDYAPISVNIFGKYNIVILQLSLSMYELKQLITNFNKRTNFTIDKRVKLHLLWMPNKVYLSVSNDTLHDTLCHINVYVFMHKLNAKLSYY